MGAGERAHTTQQRDHIPVAASTGRRETLHKQVDHACQLKDEERDAHKPWSWMEGRHVVSAKRWSRGSCGWPRLGCFGSARLSVRAAGQGARRRPGTVTGS